MKTTFRYVILPCALAIFADRYEKRRKHKKTAAHQIFPGICCGK